MTIPVTPEGPPGAHAASTRPYLIRALHDWCTDNGFTPYVAVYVDAAVQVPVEYVKNNEIVLNTSFEATSGLQLGNEFISFKARFGGTAREINVPIDHVIAIYARENGQGMAFPAPPQSTTSGAPSEPAAVETQGVRSGLRLAPVPGAASATDATGDSQEELNDPQPDPPSGGRPSLKRVK